MNIHAYCDEQISVLRHYVHFNCNVVRYLLLNLCFALGYEIKA